jgi:hypothetical protein
MKAYWGVDVQINIFLTSVLVGGEWSASRPSSFIPRKRTPRTHWIGKLGEPQSRSGRRGEKNRVPTGTRIPTPRPSSVNALNYLARTPAKYVLKGRNAQKHKKAVSYVLWHFKSSGRRF